MSGTHAVNSPSGASGWMVCDGWASSGTSSKYSSEGTAAHELGADCLQSGGNATQHIGREIKADDLTFTVDADMAGHVQSYVDTVRSLGGNLMVEQRLSIAGITGEADAEGTSDAVVILGDELIVADLKYGMGVRVDADNNPQLMIYALAALEIFELVSDFKTVRLMIIQPRLNHVSEWSTTPAALAEFAVTVRAAADRRTAGSTDLLPGEKQCKFCAKKAICVALRAEMFEDLDAVDPKEVSVDELGYAMSKVGLMEDWCKAIRAETEKRLFEGRTVNGWKLVQGKRGNRAWTDKAVAEALLKSMRLKVEEMYDLSLISPTSAEKLTKRSAEGYLPTIGPRQWIKAQALITQKDGAPSVAPESDKRPALDLAVTFDNLDAEVPT